MSNGVSLDVRCQGDAMARGFPQELRFLPSCKMKVFDLFKE